MKKGLLMIVIAGIMIAALSTMVKHEKESIAASTHAGTQADTLADTETLIYEESNELLYEEPVANGTGFHLDIAMISMMILMIALVGCVLLAKKNELFFFHEIKDNRIPTYLL